MQEISRRLTEFWRSRISGKQEDRTPRQIEISNREPIVVKPKEKNPLQIAREEAERRIQESIETSEGHRDFILHHMAKAALDSEDVRWGMTGKNYTTENLLELAYSQRIQGSADQDYDSYMSLLGHLLYEPEKENNVMVTLTRVRDERNRYKTRALAKFPNGAVINNHVFKDPQSRDTEKIPDLVFFHPTHNAVNTHVMIYSKKTGGG